jgi:hypothetical protein
VRIIQFLIEYPILLLVVLAWIAGAIANAKKAGQKRERAARPTPSAPTASRTARRPDEGAAEDAAAEVAREMRRILGVEEPPPKAPARPARRPVASRPANQPANQPASHQPASQPRRAGGERPPAPVVPTTQSRRIDIHVDPHVGEQMAHRHQATRIGQRAPGQEIGSLGGRVQTAKKAAAVRERYQLDFKRVVVLAEILGPPVGLRTPDQRLI